MRDRAALKKAVTGSDYVAIREEMIEVMLEVASSAADSKTEIEVHKGGIMAAGIGKLIRRLDGVKIESNKSAA